MEKLQECFSYHFVIRQIEEKITQEKKSEKDTGERDTFPGVGTKEQSGMWMKSDEGKCEKEESESFDTGER